MNKVRMAQALVSSLKPLIVKRGEVTFDICQIMFNLKRENTFKILGKDLNWMEFLKAQKIPMSYSNSNKAARVYEIFLTVGYSERQIVKVLSEFGLSRGYELLKNSKKKQTIVQLRAAQREMDRERGQQFHFEVEQEQAQFADRTFKKFGMEITDAGRRLHTSKAFVALMQRNKDLEKFAKGKRGVPALKAVA